MTAGRLRGETIKVDTFSTTRSFVVVVVLLIVIIIIIVSLVAAIVTTNGKIVTIFFFIIINFFDGFNLFVLVSEIILPKDTILKSN